jgi:hypothetical protein
MDWLAIDVVGNYPPYKIQCDNNRTSYLPNSMMPCLRGLNNIVGFP